MIPRENGHSARHGAGVVKNQGARCASPLGLSCFISPSLNYLFGSTFSVRHLYIIFALQFLSTYHNFAHFIQLIRLIACFHKSLQNYIRSFIRKSSHHRYILLCIILYVFCHLLPFIIFYRCKNRIKFLYFHRIFAVFKSFIEYFIKFRFIPEIFIILLDILYI